MGIVSTRLRNSARGQPCAFQIPGHCNGNPETTVLCHAPSEVKGVGTKSHDFCAAIGCSECHRALDEHRLPKVDELFYWMRGMQRTWAHWIERGLIVIPVDPATAKRRPGKKSKWPSKPIPSRPFQNKKERA